MRSSQKRNIILVIGIIAIIGISIFLSIPDPTIAPITSKVTFDSDGGTEEIVIITDADYSKWHVSSPSWLTVSKNLNSITIECSPNTKDKEGNRTGRIRLYCDGRSHNEEYITVVQDESDQYVRGKIISLDIKHNVEEWDCNYQEYKKGMRLTVKCNVRHTQGEDIKCCIWFYNSDGSKLMSKTNNYRTKNGQVTVQDKFYLSDGEDEKIQLFIPYSEFPTGDGYYCNVGLLEYLSDSDGNKFASESFSGTTFRVTH